MRKLLCEVLSFCYKISNGSKVDLFFDYAPHTNSYTVYWWRDGWDGKTEPEFLEMVTEITEENLRETFRKLREIAKELGVRL